MTREGVALLTERSGAELLLQLVVPTSPSGVRQPAYLPPPARRTCSGHPALLLPGHPPPGRDHRNLRDELAETAATDDRRREGEARSDLRGGRSRRRSGGGIAGG